MKCDEFKQKLLEEPHSDDPKLAAHRQQCPSCQAYYEETRRLEEDLAKAFQQEIDEDFLDQLQLKLAGEARRQRRRRLRMVAMAASLVLLVGLAAAFLTHYQQRSLNDFVIAHIEHEIDQLGNSVKVNRQRLERYFAQFDSQYLQVLDNVTYAEKCWMRRGFGLHLVFSGQNGPVTLLLMPNEPLENWLDIVDGRFQGRVYAMQQGSMALVGEPGEPIERLAEKLRMAHQQALVF